MAYTALSFPATTTVPASDEFIIAGNVNILFVMAVGV
jgi:hypothetical protein